MNEPSETSSTRHVWVVFGALAVLLGLALTARRLAYPKSYGQFGRFRGDAVPAAMAILPPLHAGAEVCGECHDDVTSAHAKDVHQRVQCENCHGPAGRHVDEQREMTVARADAEPLRVPKTVDDCLVCHRRLVARPASFPQIDPAAHYAMLHLKKADTPCSSCHSPHEPLFADIDIDTARLHPVINECVDCHKHQQDRQAVRPERHPVIFECGYCHPAVVKDYAGRTHGAFRCGICHQYYSVSERGGRILKHRDPRFCLLCHSGRQEKDAGGPPSVDWPAHRADMADDAEKDKDKVCADCHREDFHLSSEELGEKPGGRGGKP